MCLKTMEVNGRNVPCGKCNECLKRRKQDWSFRLVWEIKRSVNVHFVNLTYDEEHVPWSGDGKLKYRSLKKKHLTRFVKSIRVAQDRYFKSIGVVKSDYTVKFYGVGEYGTRTRRPHYHLIMYNVHQSVIDRVVQIWGKGFVKCGEGNDKTIQYTAKYLIDIDDRISNLPIEQPFSIMSKGLGENYLHSNGAWHKGEGDKPEDWILYVYNGKFKQGLPRYYKRKLFDEAERDVIGEMQSERTAKKHIEDMKKLEEVNQDSYKYINHIKEHKNLSIKMKSQLKNKL